MIGPKDDKTTERALCGLRRGLLGGTAAALVLAAGMAAPAHGQTTEELQRQIETLQRQSQQQIEALQRQLDELKQQQQETTQKVEQQEQVAPAQAVTAGDIPGSFKLPGTDTSVAIHGYVKADFFDDIDGQLGDSVFFSTLPFKNTPADNNGGFRGHAKQSRVNITTSTPTDWGTVKTVIEGDFFGGGANETASNSSGFRLRHAYGEIGPLLIGQTWTTFMDVDAYPWTVDFFGPVGFSFIRQPQIRYTHDFGAGTTLAVAVENPEPDFVRDDTGAVFGFTNSTFPVDNEVPDLILRARHQAEWGWVQLAGVGRLMTIDDPVGGDDTEFGYGLGLTGTYKIPEFGLGANTVGGSALYGEGIGRYNVTGVGHGAALIGAGTGSARLEAQESWSASGWVQHNWTDEVWSVAAVGYTETDFDGGLGAAALAACGLCNEDILSLHLNTFWEPVPDVILGIEFINGWADHETLGDRRGKRVQFGAQFNF